MSHDRYEDFETGENPPKYRRVIFAESLSVYAKSGTESGPAREYDPSKYKLAYRGDPLSAEELDAAREVWARLPRFDDLVRGRA